MEEYKIIIHSEGDGWTDEIISSGAKTELENGCVFSYSVNGDNCRLTLSGGGAVQERIGEQRILIPFTQGKKTQCVLGYGGFSGTVEVYTHALKITEGDLFRIEIDYTLGGDKIKLTFTAIKQRSN